MPTVQPAPVKAEPPRELGVDDALIIAEKLTEVYAGRDKGYGDGWSDKLVAESLNVPRDWVRQIREKRFGPAADSEDVRAALGEARAVANDAATMLKAVSGSLDRLDVIKTQCAAMAAEAAELHATIDRQFRNQVGECSRTLGRIERGIAAIEKVVV
ncbi:hypothetical protein BJ122_102232 [Rhodopseudomonas faecalis]|uniref:Uncharacterized protein n=2 Tax=Rhodopseudomonas faecalis TaxID=99655 RepID=A0A318TJW3_9BRAD|nr:hypothetical protein BJ122_102232 [Rhodopseudomonas faecalis]